MIRWICNEVDLTFWLAPNASNTVVTCWVKKTNDRRPEMHIEKYRVFSISGRGEFWRHKGLPVGWGFKLTADRKIKEVR